MKYELLVFLFGFCGSGKKCFGAKACVSSCLQAAEKYSATCADCFGDLAACTEANCLAPCIGGASAACATCTNVRNLCDVLNETIENMCVCVCVCVRELEVPLG